MTEFCKTTLPPQLEKYTALLKSRNEGKDFLFGGKVRHVQNTQRNRKSLPHLVTGTFIRTELLKLNLNYMEILLITS